MASFGDGDDGDGNHRRHCLRHQCNQPFSLSLPLPPSDDVILCPNCNDDSFQALHTIPIPGIENFSMSNITSQIAALLKGDGGGVDTCNIRMKIRPAPIIANGERIGVTVPASAAYNIPVLNFTSDNLEQLVGQFLMNSFLFPCGVPPLPAGKSGGNENSNSECDGESGGNENSDSKDLD